MSRTSILNSLKLTFRKLKVLKTSWNGWHHPAVACALLVVFAAAPLRAQFTYQDVADFDCTVGGCEAQDYGQLWQWSDGNLYGTTFLGGANDFGSIFAVTPSVPGGKGDVWVFDGNTGGGDPEAALTLAPDGSFYGTTSAGGTFGNGSVFVFTLPNTLTPLHYFNGTDGQNPLNPPTQARDGNFYGVTGSGTTYRVTYPGGVFKQLSGTAPSTTTGPLVAGLDGNLYGASFVGGTSNMGTIFKMTTGGTITVLHNFSGSDGATPQGLVQASDGNLYGTTTFGGDNNTGEVFQLILPAPKIKLKFTKLYSFSSVNPSGQNVNGAGPEAGLLAASDGYLYGSSALGGANTCGTLFRITTTGTFTKLAEFPNWSCINGFTAEPASVLVQHTNGSLYGTTYFGGTLGSGNVYTLTPTTPIPILLVEGPIWVKPLDKVTILGDGLNEATNVTFAGVQAQFQPGSNTYLIAQVPSDAVDGLITITLTSPLGQSQVQSQGAMHILPIVTNLDPSSGPVGTQVGIVGGGFAGTTKVTFGGVKATNFTVVTPALIQAVVPTGAKTGKVSVTTPNGMATSKGTFTVK